MRIQLKSALICMILVTILALNSISPVSGSEFDNEVDDNDYDNDSGFRDMDDDSENDEGPAATAAEATKYEPNWASLDSRPLPSWYDEAKIGIFIHWGVFSVPAYGGAWFWFNWHQNQSNIVDFMKKNYSPKFTYQDFGPQFTAQFYNANEWVDLFVRAGARYVVLTSKHHEGFTNWPSKYSFGWNSMEIGPKRDLIGELAAATKKTDMKFGLYHSLYEFMNPLYIQDRDNKFNTTEFVDFKTMPELYELVQNYEPEVIWSDGDWEAGDVYWKSKEFIAWLYNESPVKDTVVTNDRWGAGTACTHGDFYNCHDHYNPGVLQPHKWENAFTLDKQAWAIRIDAVESDFHTINELIAEVTTTVSCGGNVLLNVGPTKEGTIIPIMQERLLQLGQWLGVNGDAIYGSSPWKVAQNDSKTGSVWYTAKPAQHKLYAIVLDDAWEVMQKGTLLLDSVKIGNVKDVVNIGILGYPSSKLKWELSPSKGLLIHLPALPQFEHPFKSSYGWTIVITFKSSADYF